MQWAHVLLTLNSVLPIQGSQPITYDSGRNLLPWDPKHQRLLEEGMGPQPQEGPGCRGGIYKAAPVLLMKFLSISKKFQNNEHYRRGEYELIHMTAKLPFKLLMNKIYLINDVKEHFYSFLSSRRCLE